MGQNRSNLVRMPKYGHMVLSSQFSQVLSTLDGNAYIILSLLKFAHYIISAYKVINTTHDITRRDIIIVPPAKLTRNRALLHQCCMLQP